MFFYVDLNLVIYMFNSYLWGYCSVWDMVLDIIDGVKDVNGVFVVIGFGKVFFILLFIKIGDIVWIVKEMYDVEVFN